MKLTTILLGIMTVFIFNACGGDAEANEPGANTDTPSSEAGADESEGQDTNNEGAEENVINTEGEEGAPAVDSGSVSENTLLKKVLSCGDVSFTYFQYKQNTTACKDAADSMCLCEIIETAGSVERVALYRTSGARKDCQNFYEGKKSTAGACTEEVIKGEALRY